MRDAPYYIILFLFFGYSTFRFLFLRRYISVIDVVLLLRLSTVAYDGSAVWETNMQHDPT